MAALENSATSVSTLVGMSVVDASGKSYGRVHEFAVDVARDAEGCAYGPLGCSGQAVSSASLYSG